MEVCVRTHTCVYKANGLEHAHVIAVFICNKYDSSVCSW